MILTYRSTTKDASGRMQYLKDGEYYHCSKCVNKGTKNIFKIVRGFWTLPILLTLKICHF